MGALIVESLNQLNLVGFAAVLEESDGFLFGQFRSVTVRSRLIMSLAARFNPFEVLGRKRSIEGEIVIKAFFQSRADRQLCGRKDLFHGLGHDVSAAMTVDVTAFGSTRTSSGSMVGVLAEEARQVRRLALTLAANTFGTERASCGVKGSRTVDPAGTCMRVPSGRVMLISCEVDSDLSPTKNTTPMPTTMLRVRHADAPQSNGRRGRS